MEPLCLTYAVSHATLSSMEWRGAASGRVGKKRRQRARPCRAAFLALLWSLYALLGTAGLGRTVRAEAAAPSAGASSSAHSPAAPLTCHCSMPMGMRHGVCACCHPLAAGAKGQAVCRARCDMGAPAALAAAASWPVVVPLLGARTRTIFAALCFTRAPSQSLPSGSPAPRTPPPCLL